LHEKVFPETDLTSCPDGWYLSTFDKSATDYQEDSHIIANMYGNLIKKSLAVIVTEYNYAI
jgi:hypothetical protein